MQVRYLVDSCRISYHSTPENATNWQTCICHRRHEDGLLVKDELPAFIMFIEQLSFNILFRFCDLFVFSQTFGHGIVFCRLLIYFFVLNWKFLIL